MLKLRKKPMLSNEAYPTNFPNLRQCSSEAASKQRTNPKDRRAVIAERDEEVSGGRLVETVVGLLYSTLGLRLLTTVFVRKSKLALAMML